MDEENGISVEELLDESADAAKDRMRLSAGNYIYSVAQGSRREKPPVENLRATAGASYSNFEIIRYESGAIRILREGTIQPVVVKDVLRLIAAELGVNVLNSRGETKNTQILATDVIRATNLRNRRSEVRV